MMSNAQEITQDTPVWRPKLLVIIASTRPGRVGLPIGEWFAEQAKAQGDFNVQVVDLAELNLPFMDEPNHPRLRAYTHQHTKDWSATVNAADAVVLVMPEYNHGYTAPLKNAIDYLMHEWMYKPVGFVSYGGVSSGLRAVQGLKPILSALKMIPIPEAVPISLPQVAFSDQGEVQASDQLNDAAAGMLKALRGWVTTLRPALQQHRGE
ncbi:MAG: NAD(P)H-dependent oxidoreductase [Thermomicrobiales bacterium]